MTVCYTNLKWDNRFINLAKHIAREWSKDPSTKVGCVIVKDKRILGTGYNGFPRGIEDSPERYAHRPTKLNLVVHAEVNAILNAVISVKGADLYLWPFQPCSECAKFIIQSGIKRVFWPHQGASTALWSESMQSARDMFEEAGIIMIEVHEDDPK